MTSWPNGWGINDPAAIPPPGLNNTQRAGVLVTPHTALQVDTVFVALRVLTNLVIKMGSPRAYTVNYSDSNDPYHTFLPEAQQPAILGNTWGNLFQFDGTTRTVVSMALFGEAFWYKLLVDKNNQPEAIEVLHPAFVSMKPCSYGTEYWYGSGVNKVLLNPPNNPLSVIHIPFVTLPGATRGLNSIEYAGIAYALALAAMEYGQRWFAQGASPSFILSTEQKLGQEEVERIARKFLVEHSGLSQSHLPLVLDSGLEARKISSTPDEAQYLKTLMYARSVLAAWFGLPPFLVGGIDEGVNMWGRTVQEQGIQLVDFTLSGYVVRLEEAYSSLIPDGQRAKLDESEVMRTDGITQAQRILTLRTALTVTPNEMRVKELKMPPVEGGDDISAPLASNTSPGSTIPIADAAAGIQPSPAAADATTPVSP